MPSVKKVSDHYFITAPEVTITGNLTVAGTQSSVESTDSVISDRQIVLNNGETNAGITGQLMSGLEVDRGTLPNAMLVFDEADDKFKLSTDGGASWLYVLTGAASSGTGLSAVVDDTSPALGGNLEVGTQTLNNTADSISLSLATEAGGGTGVYVTNSSATNEELITKRKAMVYSLIF